MLNAPTLLIIGQRGRKAALAIPGAKFVELKNVGHLPQLEAFDVYIQAMLDFLAG